MTMNLHVYKTDKKREESIKPPRIVGTLQENE